MGKCISDCKIIRQCLSNCPRVAQCMSDSSSVGRCMFNRPMIWHVPNCPNFGQQCVELFTGWTVHPFSQHLDSALYSCPMLSMSNCPTIEQWCVQLSQLFDIALSNCSMVEHLNSKFPIDYWTIKDSRPANKISPVTAYPNGNCHKPYLSVCPATWSLSKLLQRGLKFDQGLFFSGNKWCTGYKGRKCLNQVSKTYFTQPVGVRFRLQVKGNIS